jgi:hypothetical protein
LWSKALAINLALAALALATLLLPSQMAEIAALCGGGVLVTWLLVVFARGPARHLPHSS